MIGDDIIDKCLDSIEALMRDEYKIRPLGRGRYKVIKPDGKSYNTFPAGNSCDCPASRMCKHIFACSVLETLLEE